MFFLKIILSADGIIAISAAFIALLSLVVSYWQLAIQRTFNRNQLKPLPWFNVQRGETNFSVDFYNQGQGPLIIVETCFENHKLRKKHLKNVIETEADHWWMLSSGKIIGAGEKIRIWEKTFEDRIPEKGEDMTDEELATLMDEVAILKGQFDDVTATIVYKDVYNTIYPPFVRKFDFINKTLNE